MILNLFRKKVEQSPENPYVTGNPVVDAFVGRQNILRAVKSVLNSPHKNAITLFGQRRVGKTSVLKKLEVTLTTATSTELATKYIPVYFDLMEHTHQPLEEIVKTLGIAICEKIDMKAPQWQTPLTQFLNWLVDLLQRDQGTTLVILFDEFDSLDDAKSEQIRDEFFRYLKELLSIDMKRLNIVFTIGRNIDDFKTAQALFKGIDNCRVSLLSQSDTEQLIRISEQNDSLYWSKKAIQRVWQLTNGHPYLTQLLCSLIWDRYWSQNPKFVPTATINDVESGILQILNYQQVGQNALEWLWSGLPPACRIDTAAFAELGQQVVSHKKLLDYMYKSGIDTITAELENAIKDLVKWDIIEGNVQEGYLFRVELFRRWVAVNKPLKTIMQEELKQLGVDAEQYYQVAKTLYQNGQFGESVDKLTSAIRINAYLIEAHKLLASVLIKQGKLQEAQEKLEKFYQISPVHAHPLLNDLLWEQLESKGDRQKKLSLCKRILSLNVEYEPQELPLSADDVDTTELDLKYFSLTGQLELFVSSLMRLLEPVYLASFVSVAVTVTVMGGLKSDEADTYQKIEKHLQQGRIEQAKKEIDDKRIKDGEDKRRLLIAIYEATAVKDSPTTLDPPTESPVVDIIPDTTTQCFYHVRNGDTANEVSKKFYETANRFAEIWAASIRTSSQGVIEIQRMQKAADGKKNYVAYVTVGNSIQPGYILVIPNPSNRKECVTDLQVLIQMP